jgi:O-acetyl-ADP-ribose deacetylase (regulator of RNase III)
LLSAESLIIKLMLSLTIGRTTLRVLQGDITQQDTDAIVNAANSGLLGGGGVDGAIHRAGGPKILEECKAIREQQGGCPTGQAVITSGGNLKARYVIHAVGPVWRDGNHNEDQLLATAYRNSLQLGVKHRIRTISFPSISTGAYGFPIDRASRIAFETVREFVEQNPHLEEVRFVVFSQRDLETYSPLFSEEHA